MQWHDDRITRTIYATDNSIYQLTPERVGSPANAAQISTALRDNFHSTHPKPVVARGGGTGTNGQSLTTGLMIDLKRNMNRVVAVDVEGRTAVVQPGIVTAELNGLLKEHGLFWPPHTSTLNRATVGGMISTDAAGKGSLVYGRAHRHVEKVAMLLDDGTEWVAEPVTEVEAQRRAAAPGRAGELWHSLLALDIDSVADLGLPELARGFSGYGLDRFRLNGMIDPVALVCGAEGTLGIVTEATISLSPLPTVTRLVVASYSSFDDALRDAVVLRGTGPTAIESFDETTLERGRSSAAWPALGAAVGDHHGAVLLLEYTDAGAADMDAVVEAIAATGRSLARRVVDDPSEQSSIWKVRADAVGLLAKVAVGGPALSARPTAFVEDCAVPVSEMPAFIAGFRALLDEAGLTYGMFGHADVGCVHVRPALDLTDPGQRELVADITKRVTELVATHGGLVWGEHGRGFRGAHVDEMLPSNTVALMRQVKAAFDPHDLFNPGKLYRPAGSSASVLRVDEPTMRGTFDSVVNVSVRRDYESAYACNGNGLCHHYSADEVMCPSYKATGDPALSPRGRVDMLRAWLRDGAASHGSAEGREAFASALADNLHQCLSCSACTGHCPVEVDIPELKSRFLSQYHQSKRRPLSHYVMSRFEELAAVASRFPRIASLGLKPASRVLGLVDLPTPRTRRTNSAPRFDGQPGFDVVLMPDVFTSIIEPDTLASAVAVLDRLGYTTAVAKFEASGKFDHVKGRRDRFAKAARRNAQLVRQIAATGAKPVVIEPAVALLHHQEYPKALADYPANEVASLVHLIVKRSSRLAPAPDGAKVRLLGHCTERATAPERAASWAVALAAAGYDVEAPEVGCCGMAGVFGHEVDNQAMSRTLWDLSWATQSEHQDGVEVVATGYSCRSQSSRFGVHKMRHPLSLLAENSSPPEATK